MPPDLIDTHIHFDDDRFDTDRDRVYHNAIDAGIRAMVIPATVQHRWSKIQHLTTQYDGVFAAYGLHPLFCDQHTDQHLDQLSHQLHRAVGVGECGLDKHKDTTDLQRQRQFFEAQINIARDANLPLIIHARNSLEDVIDMLKPAALNRSHGNGVIHSFNGSIQQAHRLIDLHFKLSFGGPVTFANARKIHKLVTNLPLEAMMLETDAPDQSPAQHRGSRNEPKWIHEVLQAVSTLRGEPVDEIAIASNHNAIALFQLPLDSG